jgi:hypothetical protein
LNLSARYFLKHSKTDISETWISLANPSHILVTQLFARCFLRARGQERKTGGMESSHGWPKNVTPFTIGGWPVDALSQGTMRLLRKIADQDRRTIEEIITHAMEEFVAGHKAEKKLETKIIRFPKR